MLNFWHAGKLDRREMLRVGGLALAGLSLPQLLQQQAQAKPAGQELRQGEELHHALPVRRPRRSSTPSIPSPTRRKTSAANSAPFRPP